MRSLSSRLIRIAHPAIRCPLLVLYFPFMYTEFALRMLLTHPNRQRLRGPDLWWLPVDLFWAAFDGYFVGSPVSE
jgi:hypothetical protein